MVVSITTTKTFKKQDYFSKIKQERRVSLKIVFYNMVEFRKEKDFLKSACCGKSLLKEKMFNVSPKIYIYY